MAYEKCPHVMDGCWLDQREPPYAARAGCRCHHSKPRFSDRGIDVSSGHTECQLTTTSCVRPAQPDGRRRRANDAEIVFVEVLTLLKLGAKVVVHSRPGTHLPPAQSRPASRHLRLHTGGQSVIGWACDARQREQDVPVFGCSINIILPIYCYLDTTYVLQISPSKCAYELHFTSRFHPL